MRHLPVVFFLLAIVAVVFHGYFTRQVEPHKPDSAGEFTTKRLSTHTYIKAARGISNQEKLSFWTGSSLFSDPWVIAPSSTKDRDGLGPLFNARSCLACHKGGGRGVMEQEGDIIPTAFLVRLNAKEGHEFPETVYGDQLQPRTINVKSRSALTPKPEGKLRFSFEYTKGEYPDGEQYELRKPHYELIDLAYGELHDSLVISNRYAPRIYGAGLLDAIDEQQLLSMEDEHDLNKDGISPKYNRAVEVKTGKERIGRFGLKAKHPTLEQQIGFAFRNDIGITNTLFSEEVCSAKQMICQKAADSGGHASVEIPDKLLNLVVSFNRNLGVPPVRNHQDEKFNLGKQAFYQSGCQGCHTPSFTLPANTENPLMANQVIYPYTNLALHDMGAGLADGGIEGKATGREWKTPPLWGIGLQQKVTKNSGFLHDGRARTLEEAILWHGGEAEKSQQKFKRLSKQQRQALITFVSSI